MQIDFRITPELLDSSEKCPVRVLIAVGGLFRAGELSAVRPPDLYGIKLDGERGQRTHIYTKEEILKDVVCNDVTISLKAISVSVACVRPLIGRMFAGTGSERQIPVEERYQGLCVLVVAVSFSISRLRVIVFVVGRVGGREFHSS